MYYHSLKPFQKLFQTGVPILTYHKIGARPRGARIKGLYLGEKLFATQLAELCGAGFQTPSLGRILQSAANSAPPIALTFDDGFANVFHHALKPLAENKFCAIEFLVADLIGKTNEWEQREGEVREPLMDVAQVREWLAAGHEIGSHTLTHPYLTRLSPPQAREEITASKKKLEDLFGVAIKHFCYPYGDWNKQTRDLVLEAGYRTACTTDFGVNTSETPPGSLLRITARYPSRNWRMLARKLTDCFGGK
jgi:peptidoglycan/xylan/chitin deacetylase (PgdA/CDA1 family)